MPAAVFPVDAPVQYRPPTIKRIKHTSVWHVLRIIRRPNLSVDNDQSITARRLTQLKKKEIKRISLYAYMAKKYHVVYNSRNYDSAKEGVR